MPRRRKPRCDYPFFMAFLDEIALRQDSLSLISPLDRAEKELSKLSEEDFEDFAIRR